MVARRPARPSSGRRSSPASGRPRRRERTIRANRSTTASSRETIATRSMPSPSSAWRTSRSSGAFIAVHLGARGVERLAGLLGEVALPDQQDRRHGRTLPWTACAGCPSSPCCCSPAAAAARRRRSCPPTRRSTSASTRAEAEPLISATSRDGRRLRARRRAVARRPRRLLRRGHRRRVRPRLRRRGRGGRRGVRPQGRRPAGPQRASAMIDGRLVLASTPCAAARGERSGRRRARSPTRPGSTSPARMATTPPDILIAAERPASRAPGLRAGEGAGPAGRYPTRRSATVR